MRGLAFLRFAVVVVMACLVGFSHVGSAWAQKQGASAADIEQAKKHMAAGVAFMRDPDGARYEEAYAEFSKAYELSGSLNALQNLAICSQNLELDGEAIGHYEKFLEGKGSDLDAATKQQIETDLAALKSAASWVTFSTDKVGVTVHDTRYPKRGSPINNSYKLSITGAKLGIHPGRHKFVASAEGSPDQVWEVTLENGSEQAHSFNFEKGGPVTAEGFTADDQAGLSGDNEDADGESDGLPAYPFIAGGITVAVAVPWVIFMVMSGSQKSDYDAARAARSPDQEELKSDLETTNLLADVFMAVTATGAVATIVLSIVAATTGGDDEETTTEGEPAEEEASRRPVEWALVPAVDLRGGGGAQLVVRF
jgi:hypothetical protein